ncbi:MAG: hypothetical protein K1X71_14650 [Pirellulales bacterium]|nr:hypothetical protein [Pirellulales bacterium]
MGTIDCKQVTKPLPADAELFACGKQRLARWRDSKGKTRTAPVTTSGDGAERLVIEA